MPWRYIIKIYQFNKRGEYMKIYIVFNTNDTEIRAIFSTLEKAQEYISRHKSEFGSYYYVEYEIDSKY